MHMRQIRLNTFPHFLNHKKCKIWINRDKSGKYSQCFPITAKMLTSKAFEDFLYCGNGYIIFPRFLLQQITVLVVAGQIRLFSHALHNHKECLNCNKTHKNIVNKYGYSRIEWKICASKGWYFSHAFSPYKECVNCRDLRKMVIKYMQE